MTSYISLATILETLVMVLVDTEISENAFLYQLSNQTKNIS